MRGTLFLGIVPLATVLALGACQDGITPPDLDDPSFARGSPGPPPDRGGGGGPGRGGGGGGGGKGDLYADLVFLYRDADGLPLLRQVGTEYCLQPISYDAVPGLTPVTNAADGQQVWLLPLVGDAATTSAVGTLAEEELEPCDVQAEYLVHVEEVGFGRLNLGRSPDRTLDRALDEVYLNLGGAQALLLDHAGRLAPDGVPIDAPGENLAIHRELQLRGLLGTFTLPSYTGSRHAFLDHAASGLGGAADKTGKITLDLVVYDNRILAIPTGTTAMATLTAYTDGTGVQHGVSGERYVSYRGYTYSRSETFSGCVTGYRLTPTGLDPFQGRVMDEVFGGQGFTASNVHGFAQRADDARAVIQFEHDAVVTGIDRIGESVLCTALGIP